MDSFVLGFGHVDVNGFLTEIKRMVHSIDPNETIRDEASHLNLHCLHRYLIWSAGLRGFICEIGSLKCVIMAFPLSLP